MALRGHSHILINTAYFGTTSSALKYQNSRLFTLGTSPFIIDTWFRMTADAAPFGVGGNRYSMLVSAGYQFGSEASHWRILLLGDTTSTGTGITFNAFDSAGVAHNVYSDTYSFLKNTWYHVAVSRNNLGVVSIFVNGSKITTKSNNYTSGTVIENRTQYPVLIGGNGTTGDYTSNFAGQIDEVRVVKGSWLPEAGFAVPTAPYVS